MGQHEISTAAVKNFSCGIILEMFRQVDIFKCKKIKNKRPSNDMKKKVENISFQSPYFCNTSKLDNKYLKIGQSNSEVLQARKC
jgi:hypothetical protein